MQSVEKAVVEEFGETLTSVRNLFGTLLAQIKQ